MAGCLFLTLIGCGDTLSRTHQSKESDSNLITQAKLVAEDKVSNRMRIYELFKGDPEYQYFADITMENEAGDKIEFNSLSEEQRTAFLAAWKKDALKELTKKYIEDKLALEKAKISNEVIAGLLDTISDSDIQYQEFKKNVAKKYEQKLAVFRANYTEDKNNLVNVQSSSTKLEALKKHFYPGKLLYRPSGFFGHISIMVGNKNNSSYWNPNWENDKTIPIAVSAWKNAKWAKDDYDINGSSGVIYEPLSFWLNETSANVVKFKILGLKKLSWRWNFWIGWYRSGTKASSTDYIKAANNAISKLGEDYWTHTCSSLIRDSWEAVDSHYDLESLDAEFSPVSPSDIYDSPSTYLIKTVY